MLNSIYSAPPRRGVGLPHRVFVASPRHKAAWIALMTTVSAPVFAQHATPEKTGAHSLGTLTLDSYGAASGLDLGKPSNAGSRLGLTPFETPASVDVIESVNLRQNLTHASI